MSLNSYLRACVFLMAAALAVSVNAADTLKYERYSFHEGFEGPMPDVRLWAKNGECVVLPVKSVSGQRR